MRSTLSALVIAAGLIGLGAGAQAAPAAPASGITVESPLVHVQSRAERRMMRHHRMHRRAMHHRRMHHRRMHHRHMHHGRPMHHRRMHRM